MGLPRSVTSSVGFCCCLSSTLLPLLITAAQPVPAWHPIAYKKTSGGFDDHDASCGAPAALCSVSNGAVQRL